MRLWELCNIVIKLNDSTIRNIRLMHQNNTKKLVLVDILNEIIDGENSDIRDKDLKYFELMQKSDDELQKYLDEHMDTVLKLF